MVQIRTKYVFVLVFLTFEACKTWSSYNGHEYCVSDFLKSWEEADKICRSFSTSTHLVYIESSEEQTFIESIIVTAISTPLVEFWHGINDRETEGKYQHHRALFLHDIL